MCIVSNVHDHFEPLIPFIEPYRPFVPTKTAPDTTPFVLPDPSATLRELNSLIHEFKRLLANAAEIDRVTGQPDCVDPEKAKLQDRVAELEKLLAQPPEVVIVKGGNIDPGKYRVVEGRLYKLVE